MYKKRIVKRLITLAKIVIFLITLWPDLPKFVQKISLPLLVNSKRLIHIYISKLRTINWCNWNKFKIIFKHVPAQMCQMFEGLLTFKAKKLLKFLDNITQNWSLWILGRVLHVCVLGTASQQGNRVQKLFWYYCGCGFFFATK